MSNACSGGLHTGLCLVHILIQHVNVGGLTDPIAASTRSNDTSATPRKEPPANSQIPTARTALPMGSTPFPTLRDSCPQPPCAYRVPRLRDSHGGRHGGGHSRRSGHDDCTEWRQLKESKLGCSLVWCRGRCRGCCRCRCCLSLLVRLSVECFAVRPVLVTCRVVQVPVATWRHRQ